MTDRGFDPLTVPIRPAATVMLVRDCASGPEVFMLRRSMKASFVAGMYVFPGGAVDLADADVDAVVAGRHDADASHVLGIASGGLAYWVAVARECFEEAGVLLAVDDSGATVGFHDAESIDRFNVMRHQVHDGTLRLVDLLASEGLRLASDRLHYVSHWITPLGESRRFDTRFFVARAPENQEPLHDDNETIASLWVRPTDALESSRRGELLMILPTITNLEFLAQFETVDEILDAASQIVDPPTVLPQIVRDGTRFAVLLPTDPGYDSERARHG